MSHITKSCLLLAVYWQSWSWIKNMSLISQTPLLVVVCFSLANLYCKVKKGGLRQTCVLICGFNSFLAVPRAQDLLWDLELKMKAVVELNRTISGIFSGNITWPWLLWCYCNFNPVFCSRFFLKALKERYLGFHMIVIQCLCNRNSICLCFCRHVSCGTKIY